MSLPASLIRTAGFTCLYAVATYAGRLTVLDSTNLSLVWPAAGVSAVWFLAQYTSRWRVLDVACLSAVTIVVNMATGAPPQLAASFVVANIVQAAVFAVLFRRWLPDLWGGGGDRPLCRLHELWYLVAAAVLATAAGALIGPTGVWVVNGTYSWPATAVWLTRNTVSILLIGVAGVRLGHIVHAYHVRTMSGGHGAPAHRVLDEVRRGWSTSSVRRQLEYLAVVVGSAVSYLAVFGLDHDLPVAFVLLVMTVWAGLRLHTAFVIVHDVVFGSAAVLFTLHGSGSFAHIASHPSRALVAQLFVGMVAVVGLALALSRDERHTLIRELDTARRSALDQATLMTTIVDSMAEGMTVVDEHGRVLLRNPAVRTLMGGVVSASNRLAEPGFYGLYHLDGSPLPPQEVPHRRALAGEKVTGVDILVRNAGVPDGRILRVSSTALPAERGRPRCAVTVFHDVTAERRHRDELASFAGVVAHDLLNPLATVEGWSEAVTETFTEAPDHPVIAEAAPAMMRIRRAASRMRALINDLLAYTTARDAALTPISVDLGVVVRDIVTARIDQAQSSSAPVPVFDIGDLPVVRADPVLLRQLLDNLVSNAIKYTAPGTIPQVTVTAEATGDRVTVHISDNGIGIPAGQHQSIFGNFHRAHRTSGYSGTGLGLGICQRIVERHGGTIMASDNPTGSGSRFTFTLAAADAVVPDVSGPTSTAGARLSGSVPTPPRRLPTTTAPVTVDSSATVEQVVTTDPEPAPAGWRAGA